MNAKEFLEEMGIWGIILTGFLIMVLIIGGFYLLFKLIITLFFGNKTATNLSSYNLVK